MSKDACASQPSVTESQLECVVRASARTFQVCCCCLVQLCCPLQRLALRLELTASWEANSQADRQAVTTMSKQSAAMLVTYSRQWTKLNKATPRLPGST